MAIVRGKLLVSERRRVQLLTLDGEPLQVLVVPGAVDIMGVAATDEHAYLVDSNRAMVHVLSCQPSASQQPSASESSGGVFERALLALRQKGCRWISDFFLYTLGSEARNPLYAGWWLNACDSVAFKIWGAGMTPTMMLIALEGWVKCQRWFLHSNYA